MLPNVPARHLETTILSLLTVWVLSMMTMLYLGRASYLLGAFLGGLSFCTIPSLHHHTWKHQIKRVQTWLVRIFFACTVGFEVPLMDFWTPHVWERSLLFFLALLGKGLSGLLAAPLTPLNAVTARACCRLFTATQFARRRRVFVPVGGSSCCCLRLCGFVLLAAHFHPPAAFSCVACALSSSLRCCCCCQQAPYDSAAVQQCLVAFSFFPLCMPAQVGLSMSSLGELAFVAAGFALRMKLFTNGASSNIHCSSVRRWCGHLLSPAGSVR